MLTETAGTQHSPCYSAVSSSLTNPLPDWSNYSPFCHTHYLILWMLEYFTSYVSRARPLPIRSAGILYCCSALMQNLVSNSCLRRSTAGMATSRGKWWCSSSSSNCHLNSLLSLSLFSLFLSSPSLSAPSLLFWSILWPKIKTSSFIQLVYLAKRH